MEGRFIGGMKVSLVFMVFLMLMSCGVVPGGNEDAGSATSGGSGLSTKEAAVFQPGAFFVSITRGNDNNLGTSITYPLKNISVALRRAGANGAVYVATGIYTVTNGFTNGINITNNGVRICGGYSDDFSWRDLTEYPTVLDGQSSVGNIVAVWNVSSVLVDGFVIRNANSINVLFMTNVSGSVVSNTVITNNTGNTSGYGGVIYVIGCQNNNLYATVKDNSAFAYGSLCLLYSSGIAFTGELSKNTSAYYPGMYAYSSTNCTISGIINNNGSTSAYYGGVSLAYCSGITVNADVVSNASMLTAGIDIHSCSSTTVNGKVIDNHSVGSFLSGGGITLYAPNGANINGQVSKNSAPYGGGIYLYGGLDVTIASGTLVDGNSATLAGGGIYIAGAGNNIALNGIFSNNSAPNGGGVFGTYSYGISFSGKIVQNTAYQSGGGMYISGCSNSTFYSDVLQNTAGQSGGGIYFDPYSGNSDNIISGKICGNNSSVGSGLYISPCTNLQIINSLITNNSGTTIILITNGANVANLVISNNIIGGTSASGYGIYEAGSDLRGHTLVNNGFVYTKMGYLYYDNTRGAIGTGEIDLVNSTTFIGASVTTGNYRN